MEVYQYFGELFHKLDAYHVSYLALSGNIDFEIKELAAMQNNVENDSNGVEESSFFRRSIMAMAMIAVFGYVVAFVQADRGTVHYNAYVSAYNTCFSHILDAGAAAVDCNFVAEVRAPLILHREAYAAGEPFLNMALSLTLAMLLAPLCRRISRSLLDRLSVDDTVHDPA